MRHWKIFGLAALAVTLTTLSLSQAQWLTDVLEFNEYTTIRMDRGEFQTMKLQGASTTTANSIQVSAQGTQMGVDMGGGTISDVGTPDASNEVATAGWVDAVADSIGDGTRNLNSVEIGGGTVAPSDLRLPRSSSNPSNGQEGDAYWNTTVDSLRVNDGTNWRNIGQRGAGYYEITTYRFPIITWDSTTERWVDGESITSTSRYVGATTQSFALGNFPPRSTAQIYCFHVKGHSGASSFASSGSNSHSIYKIHTSASGITTRQLWSASLLMRLDSATYMSRSNLFVSSTGHRIISVNCYDIHGTL